MAKVWQNMSFFVHFIWMRHHVYGHHSFTGDTKLDTDMKHARPLIRKWKEDKRILKCMDNL